MAEAGRPPAGLGRGLAHFGAQFHRLQCQYGRVSILCVPVPVLGRSVGFSHARFEFGPFFFQRCGCCGPRLLPVFIRLDVNVGKQVFRFVLDFDVEQIRRWLLLARLAALRELWVTSEEADADVHAVCP